MAASCTGTPTSCGSATRTGSTASPATGTSLVSASSACRSRSGTQCSTTARPIGHGRSLADEARLPVDPSTDMPDGYDESQRGQPGGFIGDPDVMDTWATSSVSPQIVSGWVDDPDLFDRVFPMDMRPQAHEIIRTWLFYSVVRSTHHAERPPVARRRDLGLRPRPRPQEALEVEGQQRGRSAQPAVDSSALTRSGTGPATDGRDRTSRSTGTR